MIIGDGIVLGAGGETASIFVTGLSETDTVTAVKNGKTVIGKWSQKPNPAYVVPDGYTQLEYIQSTGTQYIDTKFGNTQGWKVKLSYMFNDPSSGTHTIIGDLYNSGGTYWRTYALASQGKWSLGFYSNYASTGSVLAGVKYEIEARTVSGNGYLNVDGNTIFSYTTTYSAHPSTNTYLFAINFDDATDMGSGGRLYECKLYDHNDVLVREYIPVKRLSDNAIGLYDKVESKFYSNSGTGVFTAGAEVPQNIDGFLIDKIKSYGTWTVTATNGTKTATQDVLVDSAMQYEIEMSYKLWLYRDGDECENVTGGWIATGNVTKNDTSVRLLTNASNYINTVNSVDIAGYTKLMVQFTENTASAWLIAGSGYDSQYKAGGGAYSNGDSGGMELNQIGILEVVLNTSASNHWISIRGNTSGYATFDKVWLE